MARFTQQVRPLQAVKPAEQIEAMRQVVRLYLPPDSDITAEECLNKLIEMLDGPGVFICE